MKNIVSFYWSESEFAGATTMQAFVLTLLVIISPLVLCYDEKFDKIDVDKILADDALFQSYTDCMLDKGECTVEHSAEVKELLPEVIATACAKCTPIQRSHIRKSFNALQEKKPVEFEEMRKKYDPKGEHEEAFAIFLVATD